MVAPQPPDPQKPSPFGQPGGFSGPSPAGGPFAQGPGPFAAPPAGYAPPPQPKSNGCLKGCCIVAVILGVLGVIGMVVFGLNFKRFMSYGLKQATIEQCADLTPDERKEAGELMDAYVKLTFGDKSADQKWLNDFNQNINEMSQSGQDGKIEARELRRPLGRIKKALQGAGQSWPSTLFPEVSEAEAGGVPEGNYGVTVLSVPADAREKAVGILAARTFRPREDVEADLKKLPAVVIRGCSQDYALATEALLTKAGCRVSVEEDGE